MGSVNNLLRFFVAIIFCGSVSFGRYLESRHRSSKRSDSEAARLFFKEGESLQKVTLSRQHESIALECQAGGSPSPTIHWLKNGERIQQGYSHDWRNDEAVLENQISAETDGLLRLGYTKSKLYLDCLDQQDTATYTCVAETPFKRVTQSTKLVVVNGGYSESSESSCLAKRSVAVSEEPCKVFMWTSTRVEVIGGAVQLFCRAQGGTGITYVWEDNSGNVIDDTNVDANNYEVLDNGDLIIKEISWNNMGIYKCTASNVAGTDSASTFVYPTH